MDKNRPTEHILFLGATSDIAMALLPVLFDKWHHAVFHLLARNTAPLESIVPSGKLKGHDVQLYTYDLLNPPPLQFSGINYCLIFAGWLPPDNSQPEKAMIVNYGGIKTFLETLIKHNLKTLKHVMITGSVAGVRVRPANKAYGTAKAALHQYAGDLQRKWAGTIDITLVIPGYISSKMIAGQKTPDFLTLTPQKIAKKYANWLTLRPRTVYSQPAWKLISNILKLMPEFFINKMKF